MNTFPILPTEAFVLGYHSTDKEIGMEVLLGKKSLEASKNSWDWLGAGIYFWENDPHRALEYAQNVAKGSQKNKRKITTPFVLGAVIRLGNCLNMTTVPSIQILKESYQNLEAAFVSIQQKMPINQGPNRKLDCAVINLIHKSREDERLAAFDSIRCAFPEGESIYPSSEIRDRTHLQICVVNPDCILGYFLPTPIKMHNPFFDIA